MSNSQESNSQDWVAIAILLKPRGNRGELVAEALTSRPERFANLKTVHLFGSGEPYRVESVWAHGGTSIFKFAGIDSISDAERLRGMEVRVPASERIELPAGEYFHSDLIGCELRDAATDRPIGRVTGFEEYGGSGLLEIDGGRLLVPFVKAICTDIRPAERVIRVNLPDGLETLDAP
ncbi:MAG TPA: ribosome maturation factor RimM [Bryobacteraceae bacterium]|nr:ribosome maturation factor RimM [Bryobacteraceae bacterium]